MKIKIAAMTHEGVVRDHNEDNYLVTADLRSGNWFPTPPDTNGEELSEAGALLAVADGMGGMNAGEIASKIAVDTLQQLGPGLASSKDGEVAAQIKRSFQQINQAIVQHGVQHEETSGMGTTLVYAWIANNVAHIGWVGDSRAYLFRPGKPAGQRLSRISDDHSLVQQWIDEGKMNDEQAFYHPQNNIVTQSLGDPTNDPAADYKLHGLQEGDQLMLCSDGLNGMLLDPSIEEIMAAHQGNERGMAKSLIEAAIEAGGHDNITVVIAQMGAAHAIAAPPVQSSYNRVSQNTIGDGPVAKMAPVVIPEGKKALFSPKSLKYILFSALGLVFVAALLFYYIDSTKNLSIQEITEEPSDNHQTDNDSSDGEKDDKKKSTHNNEHLDYDDSQSPLFAPPFSSPSATTGDKPETSDPVKSPVNPSTVRAAEEAFRRNERAKEKARVDSILQDSIRNHKLTPVIPKSGRKQDSKLPGSGG